MNATCPYCHCDDGAHFTTCHLIEEKESPDTYSYTLDAGEGEYGAPTIVWIEGKPYVQRMNLDTGKRHDWKWNIWLEELKVVK